MPERRVSKSSGPHLPPEAPDDQGEAESPSRGFWASLGPGLIAGAADDDPSGIATYSIAGVTNGDVLRQGTADLGNGPYVARAFLRLTVPIGAATESVAHGIDQLAGRVPERRVEVSAGKLAASDLLDLNRYANSTRTQFPNWGLFQNTAWDFAADEWWSTDRRPSLGTCARSVRSGRASSYHPHATSRLSLSRWHRLPP